MTFSIRKTTPEEVSGSHDFANYCQQEMGVPYPTGKGIAKVNKLAKLFFERNPRASWATMCKVVQWCKANRCHPVDASAVFEYTRYAYAAGVLPELIPSDKVDDELEAAIAQALEVEKDADWRLRLAGSIGRGRREVLEAWQKQRASSPSR